MARMLYALAVWTLVTIAPASVRAELIYVQQPQSDLSLGVPQPSQYDPVTYGPYSAVFDIFTIDQDALIDRVVWLGAYFNPAEAGVIRNFNITFLGDADGTELIPGNANEEFVADVGSYKFYRYSADLQTPVLLKAGGSNTLWISAFAPFPPQWGWHAGTGGDGVAALVYFNELYQIPDRAFALYGTTVPEPSSIAMLSGMGALAWLGRSARRRIRASRRKTL